jgi:RND family efflux transporter MFP subunit
LLLAAGAVGAFYWSRSGRGDSSSERTGEAAAGENPSAQAPSVQVIKPRRGGLAHTTDQPGTIRAFDFAPLYSKIPGYLKELKVDRGDRVTKGQLLAQVFDPELDVAVLQAEASLQHAQAMVHQAEARQKTAEAGVKAAEAKVDLSKSSLEESVAQRNYRKKALDRISALAAKNAIEQRLVDEQEDQYMAALASEHAAESGIRTAQAQLLEARAAVELAAADLVTAKADVAVSEANLKKAKVMDDYTRIEAPFDGVITFRGEGIHAGAFIRSAADGNPEPIITVARTDKMRTIVQVPDPDVPYCDVGDPATVRLDSLPGRVFRGKISRTALAEDLKDRTMRVEIDLDNNEGLFRDGMYGRAVIELDPPTKNLVISASSLIERNGQGEGAVFVVRDNKVKRIPIKVGRDTGSQIEVLGGLSEDDEIIAQLTPSITEGITVRPEYMGTLAAAGGAESKAPGGSETPAGKGSAE